MKVREIMKQYSVGDFVRIRDWDDLESEFGVSIEDGSIDTGAVKIMREQSCICGEDYKITKFFPGLNRIICGHWCFSPEIIDWDFSSQINNDEEIATDNNLDTFLSRFSKGE